VTTPTPLSRPLSALLSLPVIDRTRRNHGLEHATMTLLSHKYRGLSMVGRSTPNGFHLYGDVSTEALSEATQEALRRMNAGEAHLAVHPNCGTNLLTAGIAAGLAAYLGFVGANSAAARRGRLPLVALFTTAALIFARPLGLEIQRQITTSGEMGGLEIVRIERRQIGRVVTHFVATTN